MTGYRGGNLEVDLSEVNGGIRRMLRASSDVRPVWRKLRRPFRSSQVAHLRDSEGPRGPFKPLAPATRAARLERLRRTGRSLHKKRGGLRAGVVRSVNKILSPKLIKGARIKIGRRYMLIRSKGPGAGIHQTGGPVGHGATVPERMWMYVSESMARRASHEVAMHLWKAWIGRKM